MYSQIQNPEIIIPDRYEVERVIADSARMSAMLARDTETGDPVFAKSLNPATDHLAAAKIANEAEILGSLDHERIPRVHDADPDASRPWIITDFADAARVRIGRRELSAVEEYFKGNNDPRLAAELVMSALEVFTHIHDRGIIQRDTKPDNLRMTWEDTRVVDFGIAQRIGAEAIGGHEGQSSEDNSRIVLLTLEYASPEQLRGGELDERSDLYSVGQILLYFLSGKSPVTGSNANELIINRMFARDHMADLSQRDIPYGLQAVVNRALQEAPESRYQSAAEMAEDLARWTRDNSAATDEAVLTAV